MGFNLFIIGIILIFGFLFRLNKNYYKIDSDSNRKKYIIFITIVLILQSGLRNVAVGPDTYSYSFTFLDFGEFSWQEIYQVFVDYYKFGLGKDPGFPLLIKIFYTFSKSYQAFLFFIAIFWFWALGNLIYNNVKTLEQTVLAYFMYAVMFYTFYSITGHRQTLAMSICLFGYQLVKKRKFLWFLLLILIAMQLNKSSLVFLRVYFIYRIENINTVKKIYAIALLFSAIFFAFSSTIINFFIFISSYEQYSEFDTTSTTNFTVMTILVGVIVLFRLKKTLNYDPNLIKFFMIYVFAIVLIPLSTANSIILRLIYYYSFPLMFIIPGIVLSFKEDFGKYYVLVKNVTIILLTALFIKTAYTQEYKFFWQEMKLPEFYNE